MADEIVTIQTGSDIMLGNTEFMTLLTRYKVNPVGVSCGILIPIKLPYFDVYYKVRAAYHYAKYSSIQNDSAINANQPYSDANYLSAINGLLVGRKFKSVSSPFSLLPQLGLGMILETPYKSYGDGVVYDLVFFDVSALFKYSFKTCGTGIMIDFQHGFYSSNKYYDKKNRLEISFVFSK
jgi:hypothetical protein